MSTATVTDITPAWDYLSGLSMFYVPSDLTEIDVNWCYSMLCDSDSEEVLSVIDAIGYTTLFEFAAELRDIWGQED